MMILLVAVLIPPLLSKVCLLVDPLKSAPLTAFVSSQQVKKALKNLKKGFRIGFI